MKITDALIKTYTHFIDMDSRELTKIKDDANDWYNRTIEGTGGVSKILQKNELWYVKLLVGLLFLIGLRSLSTWLFSSYDAAPVDGEDEDDDHYDEEPAAPRSGALGAAFQKFRL